MRQPQVGDDVIYVDQYGDEHEGRVRAVVADESNGGELFARVEVEPGVVVWEPVKAFQVEED